MKLSDGWLCYQSTLHAVTSSIPLMYSVHTSLLFPSSKHLIFSLVFFPSVSHEVFFGTWWHFDVVLSIGTTIGSMNVFIHVQFPMWNAHSVCSYFISYLYVAQASQFDGRPVHPSQPIFRNKSE